MTVEGEIRAPAVALASAAIDAIGIVVLPTADVSVVFAMVYEIAVSRSGMVMVRLGLGQCKSSSGKSSISADSIRAATTSDHDRLHATMIGSALDEALAEQRILWFELAPRMTTGLDEPNRYRDLTRRYERQRSEQ